MHIPREILRRVEAVFADVNRETSRLLSDLPNTHEPVIDHTFISEVQKHAAPVLFPNGWMLKLQTHFLGGGRHWGNWEIADIGVLVQFRVGGKVVRSKVVLLQSKRLYANELKEVDDGDLSDYHIGFAGLFRDDVPFAHVSKPRSFSFTNASKYRAMSLQDEQELAIQAYEANYDIPVYYLLYHPWTVPHTQVVPRPSSSAVFPDNQVGARVLPSAEVRAALSSKKKGYKPSFEDLCRAKVPTGEVSAGGPGWRLEHMLANLTLTCKTGYIAESANDPGLEAIFRLRGGPISSAISITIDAPE